MRETKEGHKKICWGWMMGDRWVARLIGLCSDHRRP
jgi:hypothetical protein